MARVLSFLPPAPCCDCNSTSEAPYYKVAGIVSGANSGNTAAAAEVLYSLAQSYSTQKVAGKFSAIEFPLLFMA